jgi:hypothetical protein
VSAEAEIRWNTREHARSQCNLVSLEVWRKAALTVHGQGRGHCKTAGCRRPPCSRAALACLAAAQKRVFNPVVQLAARKRPRIAIARIVEPSASCSCLASRVSNCTWSANVDIQCSHESQSGSQGRIAGAMAQSMLCGGRIVALSPQPALRAHRRLAQVRACMYTPSPLSIFYQ